jgi:hypothetical protein
MNNEEIIECQVCEEDFDDINAGCDKCLPIKKAQPIKLNIVVPSNLFEESREKPFSVKHFKDPHLLRKKYKGGKHGYWLDFRIGEFTEIKKNTGKRKPLHIHVMFVHLKRELLKVQIYPQLEINRPKHVKLKTMKGDRKKMFDFIEEELVNIF